MSDLPPSGGPPPDPEALARAAAGQMHARDRASRHLGIMLDDVGPGYARLSMEVREWMLQGHDVCHGGIMFALADTAMGFASNSHNQVHLALNANIDFLRPARLGEILIAEAREGDRTRRTGMYEVSVVDGQGRTVCRFRGRTYGVGGEVMR